MRESAQVFPKPGRRNSAGVFAQPEELGNAFCMGIGRKTDLTDPVPLFLVGLDPSFRPAVICVHFGSSVFWGCDA